MTGTVFDVNSVVGLYAAGLRALNRDLGADGAKRFMEQCFGGEGDYTAEKKLRPPMSDEEYDDMMAAIEADAVATGT